MKRRNQIIAILLTGALVGNSVSWDALAMTDDFGDENFFSDGETISDDIEEKNPEVSDDITDDFSDGENTDDIPEVEEHKDSNEINAMGDLSIDDLPPYPDNGQKFWVIFNEGFRDGRIELTTCDIEGGAQNAWIKWDRSLELQDANVQNKYNQYYLNDNGQWEQIGTYTRFTDYATNVIASNLDICDASKNLIISKKENYDKNKDFQIENGVLTAYTGETEEVTVPDGVTEIGAAVFMNNSTIKKVTLPDTVEKIGDNAFRNCENLELITLPTGLKTIGDRAFYNCKNLRGNLTLPEGLKTIGSEAFYECSGLNGDLVIPDNVETVGSSAFYNCNGFKGALKLSVNLTELSNSVFSGCSGLTGMVTIPDSVKKIGIYAFCNCSNLTDLVLGKGITNIYAYYYWSSARTAWQGCNNLETITFLGEKVPVINESLTATSSNYINYLFNLEKLKKIIVPEGSYGAYSSAYGSYLQSHTRIIESGFEDFIIENGTLITYIGEDEEVTIPDGVTEIGAKAFLNNSEVKKIILPDTVEKIGNESFRGCNSLEEMEFPSGIREIGTSAFSGCTGLKKGELPENLETIGNSAFYNCISLSGDLVIPDKVKTIGNNAFNYCKSLNGKLVLPENLEEIGSSAFYNCSSLTGKLTFPNGLKVIKDRAFYGCQGLTGDLIIPDSVETVGESAFYDCYGFNGILKLSENLKELTDSVFYNCNGLTGTVTIPDNVKKIGCYALANCGSLTDLVVGKGVTNIYSYYYWSSTRTAWQGCSSLETITFLGEKEPIINESLTATSSNTSYIGYLFDLKNLKKIIVPKGCYSIYGSAYGSYLQSHTRIIESGSEDFLIEDGVLTAYVGEAEEVSVPEGVTEIGTQAFLHNTGVKSVILPETVEKIGDDAFRGCSSLEDMELPDGLKEIGKSAFSGCVNMKGVSLPEGLEKLGAYAFSSCKSLTGNLVIPDKIKIIGDGAFNSCSGLDGTLTLPEGLEEVGSYAFYKCSGLTGALTLPENLKTIKDYAFDGCAALTGNLLIPDSVETIGKCAFYDCYGFNGILKLSENLKELTDSVFYNCNGLTGTVTIPDNVKKIGCYALANCGSLTDLVVGKGVTNIYSYYYWSSTRTAWQGCSSLETITFLGEKEPIINESLTATSSNTSCIGYLFNLSNLKTIYVMQESLEKYQSAWSAYIPSKVSFSTDTLQLSISNFASTYTGSHSVELSWTPFINSDIIGYRIYRDGELIGETSDTLFSDTSLEKEKTYKYSVQGYTKDNRTTKETPLEITTQSPKIKSIYTDNKLNKLGLENGNLYALVQDSGNLRGAVGSFYYVDEQLNRHEIGTKLTSYTSSDKEGAVYKTMWDLTDTPVGTYTVYFELTDADGESSSTSQTIVIDNTVPETLTNVIAVGDTNQIVLSWTMSHEVDTTKYYIYRKAEDEDDYTLIKKVYDRNTLSYTDTKAKENKKYYYYVTGVNSFGREGKPSAVAVAVPLTDTEAPRVVQLTPVNGSIIGGNVEFYANAQDNVSVVKTELYISEDDGETWNLLRTANSSYCSYILSTKQYKDEVISVKGLAYDARGNISTPLIYKYKIDNTGPEKVTGLSYESTATTVTLRWNDVADNDRAFFRVERKKDDGSFEKVEDVKSTLGINIYNLESDKEYVYRVTAYDQQGNRGEESDEITVKTQPDTIAPVITSIQPNANYYNKEIPLCVTATDNTGVAGIIIQTSSNAITWKDYKSSILSGTKKTETFSEIISLADMPEGDLYIRAIAADAAGNKSDSSEKAPYVQYIVDRTAPEIPKNLKADAITGAIQLTWDMGTENDINGYQVLRSTDGENYTVIADRLKSVNYWDRSAEKDVTYWYKIVVSDQAGNVSTATEPVKSVLPEDKEPPKIESFAPVAGSTVGVSNSKFSVMASDNWKVDQISVTYTVNDSKTVKTLISETGINNYYKVASTDIPLNTLKDGDVLHLSISVTDIQGMTVSKDGITYTIDKTAPKVNSVLAESSEDKITVKWGGNAEKDLAGYKIYRKTAGGSYSLIAQRSAASGKDYQYEDYNALAKETYYYKVEAVDKYGNTRSRESEAAWITVKPTVAANLNCDKVLELNTEYYFDASGSYSDIGMKSYEFDFGDGTILTGKDTKVVHRYTATGAYTVHLTVTDVQGNQSEIEKQVTVEEPKLLGTVKVKTVDASGNAVADMPVYFDMDISSDNVKYTGSDGTVTFNAGAGSYAIGTYATGYLPVKKSVVIKAGSEVQLILTVVKEPIVTGQFEVNRMTLDEIKAAGIDVSDPANQQVVKVTLHLVYGSTPITMNVVTNGNTIYSGETTIVDTGEEKRQLTATVINTNTASGSAGTGSVGGTGGTGIGTAGKNVIIAIMDVPVEASCLKEFFDVKLHIINHADKQFELTNNTVKLNVPDGMTLMNSKYTTADSTVDFGSLSGQEEKTISWVLRGDKAGEYNLTADYSAILEQFNTAVNAQFKTDTPITVYGLNAMKLVADINKKVVYGGMYFNLSLQNVGDTDMNLPELNVDGKIQSLYEKKVDDAYSSEGQIPEEEKKDREINLLDVLLKNTSGYSQSLGKNGNVEKLSAGESLTKKYVSYNVTGEDIAYLQKAITEAASELGIAVEINMVDMNLYSIDDADDKANSFFTDKNKNNLFNYFIDNNNFNYYIEADDNDRSFSAKLGEALKKTSDLVIKWDVDNIGYSDMTDITRQYVYEMLMDETFQQSVDAKVEDTYLNVTKNTLKVLKGLIPTEPSDKNFAESQVIFDALSETDNVRQLASSLKEGGNDAFWQRMLILAGAGVGSSGAEVLKNVVSKNDVAATLGSKLTEELKGVDSLIKVFNHYSTAWNDSVEISNQLVVINAAQYEARTLLGLLLEHKEINEVVYSEIQAIYDGLEKGFTSQGTRFAAEFTELMLQDGVNAVLNKALKLLDNIYFSDTITGFAPLVSAIKIIYGSFDYLFGWEDSVDRMQSLRVAASITYALRSETLQTRLSGDNEKFLMSLKYLIKIRLIGEKTWVDFCKKSNGTYVKPGFSGEEKQTLDEYIAVFKSTVLSYRDILFGEVSELYNVPKAPRVDINYSSETTFDTYDSSYEYSFNGTDWVTCDGNRIPLNPGTVGKHLWVRVKETKDNLSGNIAKIYIPTRPVIPTDLKVKYKNGNYYIEGLSKTAYYQLSEEKNDNIEESQKIEPQNGKVTLKDVGDYYPYLTLVQDPTATSFKSPVWNVVVEKANKIALKNDESMGEVSGADEYFEGDTVTIKATAKEGYDFVGWYENDKLVSEKEEYSFVCDSADHTIEARYEETKSVKVTFTGWNQRVLGENKYVFDLDDMSKVVVPNAPILDGYDFVGWSLYDQVYANDKIQEAVYSRLCERKNIQIEAKYVQKEETHTVTVINGTLSDGKNSGEYQPSSLLTVKADKAETGKKFAYWKKDGVIVGYDNTYAFYMPNQDTVLEAVYEDESSAVEANGVSYIESVKVNPDIRRLTFVSIGTVPDGCSIEYSGIVATSDADKAINGTALTSENADYIRGGGKGYKSYKYTWTKGNVTDEQTWYIRSYLKYHDSQGNIYEIYSDVYTASFRTQVVFNGWNNRTLSNKEYARNLSDITEIKIPGVPMLDGYDFTGWLLNGKLYSQMEIQAGIAELLADGRKITVEAQYKQKEEKYQVTVKNGSLKDGKQEGLYKASDLVTVTADEPAEGKEFACWKKEGVIVSYDSAYTFYMPGENIVLEAIYEESDTTVETSGITYIESVIPNTENGRLSFVSIGTVPDGCRIEYAGIVATSDSSKVTGEELTTANADYVRGGGSGYKTYKYTWTKGKVTAEQTWYVRSYLKYSDSNGNIHETYSDVISGQLNG